MGGKNRYKATQAIRKACEDLAVIIIALSFIFATTIYLFKSFAEWYQKEGLEQFDVVIIGFAILACTFAIFALRRWKELLNALADIKTLRGLLPLCASCKKIRDDKGYWVQLEIFISNHSEAEITHGICPECMKRLYGNLLKEDSNSEGMVAVAGHSIAPIKGIAGLP